MSVRILIIMWRPTGWLETPFRTFPFNAKITIVCNALIFQCTLGFFVKIFLQTATLFIEPQLLALEHHADN